MIDLRAALSANESIVPQIYEAAAQPQRWSRVIHTITEFVDCERGFVTVSYLASRRGEVVASTGFSPEVLDIWRRKYSINEWVLLAHTREPGEVIHAAATVSVDQLLQTPMGRELLEPQAIRDGAGTKMTDSPHFVGAISTYSGRHLSESAIDRLRFLSPHLARGLALHQRMNALADRAAALQRGIDELTTGLLLLTGSGDILHANPVARAILDQGDGISRLYGRLRLQEIEARKALELAIEQAQRPRPDGGKRGLFRITRPSGRRPYHAVVSPVVRSLIDPGTAPAVLLWLTDPDDRTVPSEEAIAALLDLTPDEARLTAALARGETLPRHAERARIGEATARSTLERVLARTECRSEADLVRLVLRSLPTPPC